ncbi:alanine racemase [Gleimia europaea ACS-120-V-Col10b]|uniref:Alanine racemase n=1 Tax=Gleimia europaea ACS-120-V-Col10b TaxID=883069 RepID=A0A9W5REK8_9ACTO|nr:alanine racemase [Gleimia europaea ACS-120-V-Col10b]
MSEQLAHYPAVAEVDVAALVANAARMRHFAPEVRHLGIVKADAYGHGRHQVARALALAGYDILGIAQLAEALELSDFLKREGFSQVSVFSWILPVADEAAIRQAIEAGIELSVSNLDQLHLIERQGLPARIHLKVDTGMGRAGAISTEFPALALAASKAKHANVVGVWSHLARADEAGEEGKQATRLQIKIFNEAVQAAANVGLTGFARHLAATSGQIWHEDAHFDMVRDGIGLYGLSPDPHHSASLDLGLQPVMTLKADLVQVKRVPRGQTVSYGGTWVAPTDRWLGLVPLGYGDGIPRHAAGKGPVSVYTRAGRIDTRVVGRVCMDQFVIDLGPVAGSQPPALAGDTVVLFGNPKAENTPGCPLADDWAQACGTINYEIITRLGARVPRAYS